MQNWTPVIIILFFLWILAAPMWSRWRVEKRLDALRAVIAEQDYANNHRVGDVGYYHATSGVWYPRPWNEYREGEGYYWDGAWHLEPDQTLVPSSVPKPGEVERVNSLWFAANPERLKQYNEQLERSGFGGSNGRTTCS